MKTINFELSFTNRSDYYIVLADGSNVIFGGTKEEAEKELEKQGKNVPKKYSLLKILAPNETVTGNMVKNLFQEDKNRDLLGELMKGEC